MQDNHLRLIAKPDLDLHLGKGIAQKKLIAETVGI